MERLSFPGTLPSRRRAVALGFFDGVHLGHRAVLRQALQSADLTPAVFTFDTLPKLANDGLLIPREETDRRLEQLGFAERITADFSALCALSPELFVRDVLVGALNAAVVCCGENFRFGNGGVGDAETLKQWGQVFGFEVHVLPLVTADGEAISSTRIRRLMQKGDMRAVNRLLGHPYEITAAVVSGAHLGRTLGTPTINQPLPAETVYPPFGVYASAVEVDGVTHTAVTNIGKKPTVGGEMPLAETWIFDYSGDLYGRTVTVRPVAFLRGETAFPSVEALREQILHDGEAARAAFASCNRIRAVLFDFDDTLQNRREAFLNFARGFADRHFPDRTAAERETVAQTMAALSRSGNEFPSYDRYYTAVIEKLAWQDPPPVTQLVEDAKRFFPEHTVLFPDTLQTLVALREKGYVLGIITNGNPAIQGKKLDVCGIRPLLDGVVISGEEGIAKPDPEMFRRAAARLGVNPADCLFVGDHPEKDIGGALAVGMQAVFIDASGFFDPPQNVPVIHTLNELSAML